MTNPLLKFITVHKIQDNLLKDFVARRLWMPALISVEDAIIARQEEIIRLGELKTLISMEIKKVQE